MIIENDNYSWQSRFEDQNIYIYIIYDEYTRRGFIDACGIGLFFVKIGCCEIGSVDSR